MDIKLWASAISLSIFTHISVAIILSEAPQKDSGSATEEGESGLEVGLGMAGSYVKNKSVEPKSAKEEITNNEITPSPPKKLTKEAIKPLSVTSKKQPKSKETLIENSSAKHNIETQESQKIEDSKDTKEPIKALKKQSEKTSKDELKNSELTANTLSTGKENSHKSGAKKGDNYHYFGEIMAWLNHYKRYPAELKKEKLKVL